MVQVPFQLRYKLKRRHRLSPYLTFGELIRILCLLFMLTCFLAGIFVNGWDWLWIPVLLFWFWLGSDVVRVCLSVLFQPAVQMDLLVEENGLGVMWRGKRWYLFLDGVTSVEQTTRGLWTIYHVNGAQVNIPVDAITEEQLDHLRAAAARGRRPEVIQAVIERGRRIKQILAEERQNKNT